MVTRKSPRKGSLQFWPRKRASKILPSINWNAIPNNFSKNLKGFICYKAGMTSLQVIDNTANSMTKGKKIILPVTILECPPLKILSVRLYANGKVFKEMLSDNLEKEIKKKIKVPKKKSKKVEDYKKEEYDDLRIICYSLVKKTGLKKAPDICEIGLSGNIEDKIKFVNENIGKEISVLDVFESGQLLDVRGLTKGYGLSGPVKRFGITLKSHKSEKGQRRPGSLGPWHPARVTFKAPQAGQLGMFSRVVYNNKTLAIGKSSEKEFKNIKNFGNIHTNYILVRGSIQGPAKRPLIVTAPLRPSKKQLKKSYELINAK